MSKGKDISTMFAKEENKNNGHYYDNKNKIHISPAQYGTFLQKRGKRK